MEAPQLAPFGLDDIMHVTTLLAYVCLLFINLHSAARCMKWELMRQGLLAVLVDKCLQYWWPASTAGKYVMLEVAIGLSLAASLALAGTCQLVLAGCCCRQNSARFRPTM